MHFHMSINGLSSSQMYFHAATAAAKKKDFFSSGNWYVLAACCVIICIHLEIFPKVFLLILLMFTFSRCVMQSIIINLLYFWFDNSCEMSAACVFLLAGGIINSCMWQQAKSNNLFTLLQTKGYCNRLYLLSFLSQPFLFPSLFLSLSVFFSSRDLILSAYFPWDSPDCVIAITPPKCHSNRWSVSCRWVQIWHIWWCKQNEGFESVHVYVHVHVRVCACVCACVLSCICGKKPWGSETELSQLSSCMSSIVSKNEKS